MMCECCCCIYLLLLYRWGGAFRNGFIILFLVLLLLSEIILDFRLHLSTKNLFQDMDLHEDEHHLRTEIVAVENLLKIPGNENSFPNLCKLAELLIRSNKASKSWTILTRLLVSFKTQQISIEDGLGLVNVLLKYW